MKKFILSADAGCDLTPELCKQYDVTVLPLRYMVGGIEYSSDDGKMPAEKICEHMLAGDKTSTSQANPEEAENICVLFSQAAKTYCILRCRAR